MIFTVQLSFCANLLKATYLIFFTAPLLVFSLTWGNIQKVLHETDVLKDRDLSAASQEHREAGSRGTQRHAEGRHPAPGLGEGRASRALQGGCEPQAAPENPAEGRPAWGCGRTRTPRLARDRGRRGGEARKGAPQRPAPRTRRPGLPSAPGSRASSFGQGRGEGDPRRAPAPPAGPPYLSNSGRVRRGEPGCAPQGNSRVDHGVSSAAATFHSLSFPYPEEERAAAENRGPA